MTIRSGVAALSLFVMLSVPAIPRGQSRSAVPPPESVFGFAPGADYRLATYDQSIQYFKKLDAASKYVTLVQAGTTSQGRPMYFALISAPKNLARIDRYREIAQRLAHPGGLSDRGARQLAAEGKAFVSIDGGVHADEVAGPQHTPLLAYHLVNGASDPAVKAILENVILMLWPTVNPDGQQMVSEWYARNVGTPYELSSLPRLYQEYVGHDNNRDAYMLNMIESRVAERAWRQWEPQIIYVHHQTAPFPTRIWLPPFSEPVGSAAPALMSREVNMIGMAIAKGLDERGQRGATHMGAAYDAWYAGYIDYAPNFKNIAAFWTETALYALATPHEYTVDDLPSDMRDLRPRSLYSSPWTPGWWRLRDAVEYMETASFSVLEYAAKYKDSLLLNRYKAGRDQIARGAAAAPYAYIVRQDQRDPVAPVELLRRLAFGGVRVSQLMAASTIDGVDYPAGTWVIPADQEFGALTRELLDVQAYPDLRQYPGGPIERPYDAAGWTLPLQMGVDVITAVAPLGADVRSRMRALSPGVDPKAKPTPYPANASDAAAFDSVPGTGFDADPAAAAIVPLPGTIVGGGPALAIDPAQNNVFRAINRAWKEGASIQFLSGSASAPARYVIAGLSMSAQSDIVQSLALAAERTTASGTPVRKPRIGVYQPWTGSIDEGWTRWVLEQYGFEYVIVRPDDFHAPLGSRIDVLVLADDARIPLEGGGAGVRRDRAVRPEYGATVSADDIRAFGAFIRKGGTLVCLNRASTFAIDQFELPVRNVVAGLRADDFSVRGSIVEILPDLAHRLMAGMPASAAVIADSSPVFTTLDGFKGAVLARYRDTGSPLLSGSLVGEARLQGKAAALDVQLDAGHIVLLGFRPQWRGQSFGAFRVLFNAVVAAPGSDPSVHGRELPGF